MADAFIESVGGGGGGGKCIRRPWMDTSINDLLHKIL